MELKVKRGNGGRFVSDKANEYATPASLMSNPANIEWTDIRIIEGCGAEEKPLPIDQRVTALDLCVIALTIFLLVASAYLAVRL